MRGTLSPNPLPALLGVPTDVPDLRGEPFACDEESEAISKPLLSLACEGLPEAASCTLSCKRSCKRS